MRAATAAFGRVVSGSHRLAVRCDVLFDREVIQTGLPITGGTVTYDRTAERLASLSATFADPLRVPVSSTDYLTPYGYELQVFRGVYVGGTPELLPLGVFPIQRSTVARSTLISSVTAPDRSLLVQEARFEDAYQVASGTNYATAIEALISDGVSGLSYNLPTTPYTTPKLTFDAQSDRWEAAQKMARSCGWELYFDGNGDVTARNEPNFDAEPVATLAVGSNLTDGTVTLDREPAFNKVIAVSRNASTGDQFRGEAEDDDPTSPTQYGGPFGKKPRFFFSEFLTSDAQCTAAAQAVLASELGVARSYDLSAVPDPRLEAGDVVRVTDATLSVDDLHILDRLTLGLSAADAWQASARAKQEAS